jgi:Fe-S cluster assembly iron-binding protein IscA
MAANSGCSAFSYQLNFDKEQTAEDAFREIDGVKVYVEHESAPDLKGTLICHERSLRAG